MAVGTTAAAAAGGGNVGTARSGRRPRPCCRWWLFDRLFGGFDGHGLFGQPDLFFEMRSIGAVARFAERLAKLFHHVHVRRQAVDIVVFLAPNGFQESRSLGFKKGNHAIGGPFAVFRVEGPKVLAIGRNDDARQNVSRMRNKSSNQNVIVTSALDGFGVRRGGGGSQTQFRWLVSLHECLEVAVGKELVFFGFGRKEHG